MPGENLKFLHASDLNLDQPMSGLGEVPESLESLLVDAPLRAATSLFETAVMEDVDFVVLSGDVLDPRRAGPRVLTFLLDQFELLGDQRIAVYWCGGRTDPCESWPEDVVLPGSVQRFPTGKLKALVHKRGETPLANIIGIGSPGEDVPVGEYRTQPSNLFTLAIAYGACDTSALAAHKQIDYWALGGSRQPRIVFQGPQTALYPGSTQGRSPGETGPHGGVLVTLDHGRKVRTKAIAVDAVRWWQETIRLEEDARRSDLQRALRAGMQRIAGESGSQAALVRWAVQSAGGLDPSLRNDQLNAELVDWLRTEFGRAEPPIWTVDMQVASAAALPEELYEEDTILGDFLRAVRDHQQRKDLPLDLAGFLPDLGKQRGLAAALGGVDSSQRAALLQEAAVLGVDLLQGEESVH